MSDVFNRGPDTNPVHTGLYVVDRGDKLGTPFRWFDAESSTWGRCEYTLEDAMNSRGHSSAIGWLPWRGPVKVAKAQPAAEVALVAGAHTTNTNNPVDFPKTKPTKAVKVAKPAKVAKPKVAKAPRAGKTVHPDGTIVYRADRNKYMAWYGGKSEAARPTVDAAKSFLTKKYGITEFTVIDK